MQIVDQSPPVSVFCDLRAQAGWGELDRAIVSEALSKSLVSATAYIADDAIGFVRAVGDGVMYFYICDLIVDELHRGKGVATVLMAHLMKQIRVRAPQGATLALMSADGKEALYEKFGFVRRPNDGYGAGMTLFLEPAN